MITRHCNLCNCLTEVRTDSGHAEFCAICGLAYNSDAEVPVVTEMVAVEAEKVAYGWKCPDCGRIFSPTFQECSYCNLNVRTEATGERNIQES